jgi:hypothetical protein
MQFFLLDPSILITLFSNSLILCSSLSLRDKFHSHSKQQVKLKFCVFYVFKFLGIVRKDKRFWTEWQQHLIPRIRCDLNFFVNAILSCYALYLACLKWRLVWGCDVTVCPSLSLHVCSIDSLSGNAVECNSISRRRPAIKGLASPPKFTRPVIKMLSVVHRTSWLGH